MPVIDIEDLDAVLRSEERVVVDFTAEWCIPCRVVEDVILRVMHELESNGFRVVVCKVNVAERPDLAARYGVLGLPTVLVFIRGQEVMRHVGGPAGLESKLRSALLGKG